MEQFEKPLSISKSGTCTAGQLTVPDSSVNNEDRGYACVGVRKTFLHSIDSGFYDPVGDLTNIVYPVSPSITLRYDALNRLSNMVDAVGLTTYGYDKAGQVLSEDGPWADDTVSYTYTNRLRSSVSVMAPNSSTWVQTYGYDPAKRLTNVTSVAGSFGYGYDPLRHLQVSRLALHNGAIEQELRALGSS